MSLRLYDLGFQIDQKPLIQNLHLEILEAEIFCLLGPSGCGKSTLLKLIAGFLSPSQGEIWISEENVSQKPTLHRRIGFFFQSYALFPHLSVEQNISFGFSRSEKKLPAVQDWIDKLIDITQLQEHRNKKPHQLSGGQQQRVALARSLSLKPDVLLLDEPLSALDPKTRSQLQIDLRRTLKHFRVTTLMVTHDVKEAQKIGDQIGLMNQGQIKIPTQISQEDLIFA